MIGPQIDMSDVDGLSAAWRAAPEIVIEELTKAVMEAELLLWRETVELTPRGVGGGGGLAGSIQARDPVVMSDAVIGTVGTSLDYAVPVETGTRPHMPPIQPLQDWAMHVLGVSSVDAPSVAWAVARKIAARGTEGAHMFERAFTAHRGQVERMLEAAHGRIVRRMAGGAA